MKKLLAFLFGRKNRCSATEYKAGDPDCERLQNPYIFDQMHILQARRMKPEEVVSDGAALSRGTTILLEDVSDSRETVPQLFLAIQNSDGVLVDVLLERDPNLASNLRHAGQTPLHAACHSRNLHALTSLIQHGAKTEMVNHLGRTPLHVAVDEEWHDGVTELLEHGASPNTLFEPPKTVREVRVETPFHAAARHGDLVSATLLFQHHPDFSLRDSDGCNVLHLAAYARSVEITRLLLQKKACRKLVKTTDKEGDSVLHRVLQRPCDSAEEGMALTVVKELIDAGANVNAANPQKVTPLFLAARQKLSRIVEGLLAQGADPTLLTSTGQSVLHAACLQGCGSCLALLLRSDQAKALVTAQDNMGYEPFHYAVNSSSIDCCELLLIHGDHLTRVNKDGLSRCLVILRHLPSATELLKRLFDASVRLSNLPQHDPDYRITFDYTCLYQDADGVQSSVISELSNSNLESLLKHPLLESFLFFKWRRIKPFFYCSVSLFFMFLLLHTTFIIMTFGGSKWQWSENTQGFTIFLIMHITMFLLILIPDLIIMFANFKKYVRQWETVTKAVALLSSAFVIFSYIIPLSVAIEAAKFQDVPAGNMTQNDTEPAAVYVKMLFVRRAAAISAFFTWVEFMMLLGRFPSLGSYVLMFTRVARSIIKFLAAFSSLIIGFAVSFMVLFQQKSYFSTFPFSLVKTLMMMIGEIDYADLVAEQEMPVLSCLFLVFFLFLVCVLVANLLIGLAVNDIPDLQRQGKIKRLSKQASYLVSYERLMRMTHSLRCFPRQLRILMTSRCRVPQVVTVLPNKDNSRLAGTTDYYHLPSETLHEAIILGTEDSREDFSTLEEEDDIATQFRSFKVKYARDRRHLNRRLAQLPDTATTDAMLKQRLDRIEQLVQQQLMQLTLQLSQFTCTSPLQQQLSYPTQQHAQSQARDGMYHQDGPSSEPHLSQNSGTASDPSPEQHPLTPQQTGLHSRTTQTQTRSQSQTLRSSQIQTHILPQTLHPSQPQTHTQPQILPSSQTQASPHTLHHSRRQPHTLPHNLQSSLRQTQMPSALPQGNTGHQSASSMPQLSSAQVPQSQSLPVIHQNSSSEQQLVSQDGYITQPAQVQHSQARPSQQTQEYQQLDQGLKHILSHHPHSYDKYPT